MPRNYFAEPNSEITLYIFSDASYAAPASVAYLVYTTDSDSRPKNTFALGKAREAPLKQHTITKLKLQAALFGARLASIIKQKQRFSLYHTYLWTDSSTVLQWFRRLDKRQQIFVANRVAEILELTQSTHWKHCPGYLNPADDGTRGIPFSEFNLNSRWFNGPDFILQPEDAWPKPPFETASPSNTMASDRQHDCVFSVTENCLPDQHHSCYVTAFHGKQLLHQLRTLFEVEPPFPGNNFCSYCRRTV